MVTHTFKAKADTQKKREPPTHTQHSKQTTQPSKHKQEGNETRKQHAATPQIQKDRQSKTEHKQDAGPRVDRKANNVPLTPGSTTRVLRKTKKKTEQKKTQTSKQHVPATHVSYQSTNQTANNTKKTKARPRREKGERVDQPKVGKRFLPPPSCRLAILPIHEGVGRDGLSARGG